MRVLRSQLAALLPVAALALTTAALDAQSVSPAGRAVVIGRAAGMVESQDHREIPPIAARALIAAHHPEVIDGTSDAAMVTLVLDNNSNYVASAVSKPATITRAPDGSVMTAVGTFAAAAGGTVTATPVAISGGSTSPRAATATMTVAGIGPIDSADIAEMFFTKYAAGDVGPNAVQVRFVILKAK